MPATLSSVVTRGYAIPGSINLVVTNGYALTGVLPASAALSGSIVPTATEDAIRAGGETIVITLTNDTWAAAGASFDAIRQDIIDGLVSAQAEPTGWNAAVTPFIPVTAVVRTSDTVVTITLPAFPAYDITAPETITDTVPQSALVIGSAPLVASPTFEITVVTPPDTAQRFGGGPFWRREFCDWNEEDERELRRLEREERELEKRVEKAQRALSRSAAPLPEATSEAQERRRIAKLDAQTARIDELVGRLERVTQAAERKRREREEADDFFDCITTILMDEE